MLDCARLYFCDLFCTHASVAIGLGIAVVRPSSDTLGGLQMTRRSFLHGFPPKIRGW
jgi:hypothetical protein